MEKMCQSYSSMMFSISRASCWMEAPNWKNVDFTSWEKRQQERGVEGRRIKGGGRRDLVEDLFGFSVLLFSLLRRLIQTASPKYQSTTEHLNFGTKWTQAHAQTHAHTDTQRAGVISFSWREKYGWGAQNNSIKPKLDWCSTGRLQNSMGLILGNEGYIHYETHTHIHSIKPESQSFAT